MTVGTDRTRVQLSMTVVTAMVFVLFLSGIAIVIRLFIFYI